MDDATQTDNLPELVARLREKRPDLAGRLPVYPMPGFACGPMYSNVHIGDGPARAIVIGVCSEALARSGWGMAYDNDVWAARANVSPVKIGLMPESPDYLTSLVEAVIALAEEARRG